MSAMQTVGEKPDKSSCVKNFSLFEGESRTIHDILNSPSSRNSADGFIRPPKGSRRE